MEMYLPPKKMTLFLEMPEISKNLTLILSSDWIPMGG